MTNCAAVHDDLDPVGQAIQPESDASEGIQVDFAEPRHALRPIHGMNKGPGRVINSPYSDLTAWWEPLRIPTARLHDTPYDGNPDTVDIHCVFPDFHADPENPASYRFKRTDHYIQAIVDAGARVIYRLGESIDHSADPSYIDPPADPERWAKICLGIIRHYNEGWAGGYRHGIQYWEIWNEPEQRGLWRGTPAQYCDLYEAAARAIKRHDPGLKVGGPGSSGSATLQQRFLAWCRDREIPLDFYSTHVYGSLPAWMKNSTIRQIQQLRSYGFDRAEYHLNEWHYFKGDWARIKTDPLYRKQVFSRANGPVGAAYVASSLILLQDTDVAMTNFYHGGAGSGFSLFDAWNMPWKTYYAFLAFAWLLDMPERVACEVRGYQVEAAAVMDRDRRAAILAISNCTDEAHDTMRVQWKHAPFPGPFSIERYVVDASHDLEMVVRQRVSGPEPSVTVECPAGSIQVIKCFWK